MSTHFIYGRFIFHPALTNRGLFFFLKLKEPDTRLANIQCRNFDKTEKTKKYFYAWNSDPDMEYNKWIEYPQYVLSMKVLFHSTSGVIMHVEFAKELDNLINSYRVPNNIQPVWARTLPELIRLLVEYDDAPGTSEIQTVARELLASMQMIPTVRQKIYDTVPKGPVQRTLENNPKARERIVPSIMCDEIIDYWLWYNMVRKEEV